MCGDTDIYYMYTMYECILKIMICTVQYIYVQVHNYVGIVLYMYIRTYVSPVVFQLRSHLNERGRDLCPDCKNV